MYLLPMAKPRVHKTSKMVLILFQICHEMIGWRQMIISTKTRKDWENPCFRWQQPRLWNNCFLWLLFAQAPNGFCSCSFSESLANSRSMSDRIIILQGKNWTRHFCLCTMHVWSWWHAVAGTWCSSFVSVPRPQRVDPAVGQAGAEPSMLPCPTRKAF